LDIHFDPVGGWSGDMFVAALLDAFPEFWPQVQSTIESLKLAADARCTLVVHRDHGFAGSRFLVDADAAASMHPGNRTPAHRTHDHVHSHDTSRDHADASAKTAYVGRTAWADIRADLARSELDADVGKHALAIFGLLARAEAKAHGIDEAHVTFHEVGAIDSIVDIVAAARLITLIGAERWTSAPLPLGSGRIETAHGVLPVPAPAAAILMQGLQTIDDGIPGERVTPTGAAIACYLIDSNMARHGRVRRLSRSGTGFGARTLSGISNCLRVLAFDEAKTEADTSRERPFDHRQLGVITFEIDDQTAEDLAAGLDHIRKLSGVFDVTQGFVVGKKGRMVVQIQILVAPSELDDTIAACFNETTTIGLRYQVTDSAILRRAFRTIEVEGEKLQVKVVDRPDGVRSGKTETSNVAKHRGHIARERRRREAVAQAIGGDDQTE
jgi:uncharacterized protein (TIGR00299 family) protein